ncbi:hypothetical protein C8R42DRAFT_724891 [Lentinula raphanica]|nr:hypothetical protein C8R42DRAFT_724891 [Lentinula raphanica]
MATTSATPLSVSLPSIHEMFPGWFCFQIRVVQYFIVRLAEHLLKYIPNQQAELSSAKPNVMLSHHSSKLPYLYREHHHSKSGSDSQIYSFDVLRSDPSSSSLQHIASSATVPHRPNPNRGSDLAGGATPIFRIDTLPGPSSTKHTHAAARPRYPHLPSTLSSDSDQVIYSSDEVSDDGDDKKHVCNTCHKRFNRPSSLRIHMNTHTGATPFRCPYPGCGREFNVNSNMRRHYRNHSNPPTNRSQGKEDSNVTSSARRRKRRTSRSPPRTTHGGPRSPTDNDFLVLRSDVPMYAPQYEPRGSGQRNVPFGFLTPSQTESFALRMAEVSEESDAESSQAEDEEVKDEDGYYIPFYTRSSFRLQPVSDFHDRYSSHALPSRYEQSDIRSLPPPPRPHSASSSCSPPPSSPISPGSTTVSGTSPTGFQGNSTSTGFRR